MPAVPKVFDVPGKKRPVKVFRGMNPEQLTEADRKCAVSGEVEEQIKGIRVHVGCYRSNPAARRDGIQPILFDQRGQNELVQESREDAMNAPIQVEEDLGPASVSFPIFVKPFEAVDGSRRNGGKEQQI